MKPRLFAWYLIILMGLDFITTEIAMIAGLFEANPIMKAVVEIPALFLAVKILAVLVILQIYSGLDQTQPAVKIGMPAILIFMAIVIAWNVYQILTAGDIRVIL